MEGSGTGTEDGQCGVFSLGPNCVRCPQFWRDVFPAAAAWRYHVNGSQVRGCPMVIF